MDKSPFFDSIEKKLKKGEKFNGKEAKKKLYA
jgi:hypothetical protein